MILMVRMGWSCGTRSSRSTNASMLLVGRVFLSWDDHLHYGVVVSYLTESFFRSASLRERIRSVGRRGDGGPATHDAGPAARVWVRGHIERGDGFLPPPASREEIQRRWGITDPDDLNWMFELHIQRQRWRGLSAWGVPRRRAWPAVSFAARSRAFGQWPTGWARRAGKSIISIPASIL